MELIQKMEQVNVQIVQKDVMDIAWKQQENVLNVKQVTDLIHQKDHVPNVQLEHILLVGKINV